MPTYTKEDRYEQLRRIAEGHLGEVERDEDCDCDCSGYAFDAVMMHFLGEDVFERMNVIRQQREIRRQEEKLARMKQEAAER